MVHRHEALLRSLSTLAIVGNVLSRGIPGTKAIEAHGLVFGGLDGHLLQHARIQTLTGIGNLLGHAIGTGRTGNLLRHAVGGEILQDKAKHALRDTTAIRRKKTSSVLLTGHKTKKTAIVTYERHGQTALRRRSSHRSEANRRCGTATTVVLTGRALDAAAKVFHLLSESASILVRNSHARCVESRDTVRQDATSVCHGCTTSTRRCCPSEVAAQRHLEQVPGDRRQAAPTQGGAEAASHPRLATSAMQASRRLRARASPRGAPRVALPPLHARMEVIHLSQSLLGATQLPARLVLLLLLLFGRAGAAARPPSEHSLAASRLWTTRLHGH